MQRFRVKKVRPTLATRLAAGVAFVLFAVAGSLAVGVSFGEPAPLQETKEPSEQMVIMYKPGADTQAVHRHFNKNNVVPAADLGKLRAQVVQVPTARKAAVVQELAQDPNVESVQPDYIGHTEGTPNDPLFSQQYYWNKVGATQAWDTTTGSQAVTIADLDTGADINHDDLVGRITVGYNFVDKNTDLSDAYHHGTAVAAVIAAEANNGIGMAGGCWNCKTMVIKVFNDQGTGTASDTASGIQYAVDHGAKVINLSISFPDDASVIKSAIDYAANHGVLVVAAAGNQAATAPRYPAAYPSVLSVAASDQNDALWESSNTGDTIDMAAPGTFIMTANANNTFATWSGTSFAAPIVASAAGLLMSAYPQAPATTIRTAITANTDPCCGNVFPAGRLNVVKALAYLARLYPAPDTTKPTVAITAPANGSTVSGSVSIAATASDNVGVTQVQFSVDTATLSTKTAAPYTATWNSATVADGQHAIKATAKDAAGNSTTVTINVTVKNAVAIQGDLNGDGKVNITDLSILLSAWSGSNATADINKSGKVDITDLSILLSHWTG